ncbi:MAG: CcmD family protein [Armatimonadota bacterium]|nr:CcmD family protein [Armatimonadota bacterium]MDR7439052.1 CcmD family protein [Armatimonadota bacterium]MDR7563011.1 CcmD family protein [Armatimonadota bacterium]MDR7568462.1 CcmD family protein [Armatimonadota bacterium]MDR7600855.1 CcmD family protein [Armatimonadota bacterium]
MIYLFWAYWLVWAALVMYLVWLHHRARHLQQEITRLEAELRERRQPGPHTMAGDRR